MNQPNPGQRWAAPTYPAGLDPYGRPPPPRPASPAVHAPPRSDRPWLVVSLVAAGVMALGSVAPWVQATAPLLGQVDIAGTEGDGLATLALGVLAGVLPLTKNSVAAVFAFLACLAGLVIAVYDIVNITEAIDELGEELVHASVGIGLWMVAAGGAVGVISNLVTASAAKH